MTTVDLDRLLAYVADRMREWVAAVEGLGSDRMIARWGRASGRSAPEVPGSDGAGGFRAGLIPITSFGIDGLDVEAVVRRTDPASLGGRGTAAVRFTVLDWAPPEPLPPRPTTAFGGERLHVHLDATVDGFVRLGAWRTPVRAGRRFTSWSEQDGADAAHPPLETATSSKGAPTWPEK